MQTKERRRAPSRMANESKRGKPLVLESAWVALASQCATRFLLSAVLAVGDILGGYSPFALGFVAASGPGAGGFFALLGASMGYLLSKPLVDAFRYLATAILIYAVAFAFYDLKIYTTRFFMPLSAVFLGGLTGFVYLAEAGWAATEVICFATELVLVGVSARFFTLAARRDATPDQQRLATLLTLGAVAIALQAVPLPFSLSLGGILCAAAVLWAGALRLRCLRPGPGAVSGSGRGRGLRLRRRLRGGRTAHRRGGPLGPPSGGGVPDDRTALRHPVEFPHRPEFRPLLGGGFGLLPLSGHPAEVAGQAGPSAAPVHQDAASGGGAPGAPDRAPAGQVPQIRRIPGGAGPGGGAAAAAPTGHRLPHPL